MKVTKSLFSTLFLLVVGLFLSGCGQTVEVPPAHIGKLSTGSGLQEGIIQPSKIRLDAEIGKYQSLILAEASDHSFKESMLTFMPKDKLNLTVEVRGTLAVSPNEANIEKVFARLAPSKTDNSRVSRIDMDDIYKVYGEPLIREVSRTVVTKYTIDEVMQNRDAISAELEKVLSASLKDTPLTLRRVGLADIQPPTVIIDAQETAKKREIEIQKAEAEKQIKLHEAEAALEVAIKQQQVDLKEAETQVLVEKKLAEGVNQAFIAQRGLKILEAMATSPNKVFFMPQEALANPTLVLGSMNNAFSDGGALNRSRADASKGTNATNVAAATNTK